MCRNIQSLFSYAVFPGKLVLYCDQVEDAFDKLTLATTNISSLSNLMH